MVRMTETVRFIFHKDLSIFRIALNICNGYNGRQGRTQSYHPGEMSPNG